MHMDSEGYKHWMQRFIDRFPFQYFLMFGFQGTDRWTAASSVTVLNHIATTKNKIKLQITIPKINKIPPKQFHLSTVFTLTDLNIPIQIPKNRKINPINH